MKNEWDLTEQPDRNGKAMLHDFHRSCRKSGSFHFAPIQIKLSFRNAQKKLVGADQVGYNVLDFVNWKGEKNA